MSMKTCASCDREISRHTNHCSWTCHVDACYVVWCPNDLPVASSKPANGGLLLEHEHGDHPGYRFPVTIDFIGDIRGTGGDLQDEINTRGHVLTDEEYRQSRNETHALIYADGCIALTLYEHCYAMWHADDGSFMGGALWSKHKHRLSTASLAKIKEPWLGHGTKLSDVVAGKSLLQVGSMMNPTETRQIDVQGATRLKAVI